MSAEITGVGVGFWDCAVLLNATRLTGPFGQLTRRRCLYESQQQ